VSVNCADGVMVEFGKPPRGAAYRRSQRPISTAARR
jgi:hypothetical protein